MPGFPDSFMPFMNEPTGGNLGLSAALIKEYGDFVHRMRRITGMALNLEPEWRHNGPLLTSGYEPYHIHCTRARRNRHDDGNGAAQARLRSWR